MWAAWSRPERSANTSNHKKIKVSHNLVIDYLSYLTNALLVLRAQRYDVIGKQIFEIGEKYYFEDLGIRHALVGFRATDINKILENLVNHLWGRS